MNRTFRTILFPLIRLRRWFLMRREIHQIFAYDKKRYLLHSGAMGQSSEYVLLERIIMGYHVIEKGLTMPGRRLGFGRDAILSLIDAVEEYESKYGTNSGQVVHAGSCVKEYLDLHEENHYDKSGDVTFWDAVEKFCKGRIIDHAQRVECEKKTFFKDISGPFDVFAASRHTVRYFCGKIPSDAMEKVVSLAMTAPSACNRQYVRVHCVDNPSLRDRILSLQNGNRGFGSTADKLLVITSDLQGLRWHAERNDIYLNAGIFVQNLCYALHFYGFASCILNWSVSPRFDMSVRGLLDVKDSETIVALVACGDMPDKISVAASPRKQLSEVLVWHK